jgi:hypothetical protein
VTKPKKRAGDAGLRAVADAARALASTAKAAGVDPEREVDPDLAGDVDPGDMIAEEEIEAAVASIPGRAEAQVERRSREGRWVHLDTIHPDQVSTSQFAEMYGGGIYRVKFRGPGTGKMKGQMVWRPGFKLVEVDDTIPKKAPPKYRPEEKGPTAAPGLDVATEMAKLSLTVMNAVGALMAKAMQPDPIQQEILRSLLNRKEPDSLDRALAIAKELRGGSSSSLKDRLEELELIESIAERRGGGRETGTTPWDLAKQGLETVARMLPAPGAAPAAPGAPQPSTPAPAPEAPPPVEGTVPADPVLRMLGTYMPRLVEKAQQDRDPDTWAGVLLEEIPPGFYPRALEFARQPDLLEQLTAAYPATVPVREWFGELLEALKDRLEAATVRPADGQADG